MSSLFNTSLQATEANASVVPAKAEIQGSPDFSVRGDDTVTSCLKRGVEFLASSGVPEPRISAETLLSYVLNRPRFSLYLAPDLTVEGKKWKWFEMLLEKRASRYPLQYLIGQVLFRNVTLEVGEGCLIPRPETETLVEAVLKTLDETSTVMDVLDVGTGSGNIAVSLAQERSGWKITGTDMSLKALTYAQSNAQLNSVGNQVRLIKTDLWKDVQNEKFDIIVSNPPYLTSAELKSLQPEIVFEPLIALDGGADGLDFFMRIIQNAHTVLKPNGLVFFEVGLNQAEAVRTLFDANHFQNIRYFRDDLGIDRIVSAQLSSHG